MSGSENKNYGVKKKMVMIPALRDLAHPLAYWLIWSTGSKVAEV